MEFVVNDIQFFCFMSVRFLSILQSPLFVYLLAPAKPTVEIIVETKSISFIIFSSLLFLMMPNYFLRPIYI